MAVGDAVTALSSIATTAYLDLQPTGTTEWIITNIYHEGDVSIEWYSSTGSIIFDSATGAGAWCKYAFHCTNARRIRVKNTMGTSKLIGYDGWVSKA